MFDERKKVGGRRKKRWEKEEAMGEGRSDEKGDAASFYSYSARVYRHAISFSSVLKGVRLGLR